MIIFEDSRKRYKALLGEKGNFMYDIEVALKLFENKLNLDAFSLGQLESKKWAVDEMLEIQRSDNIYWGNVFVLCGWYGILPAMMFYSGLFVDTIRSFDIDESCEKIADSMNKTNCNNQWRFKAITQDIADINFEKHTWRCWSNKNNRMSYPITDEPDTIINTSCEHTNAGWFHTIPDGKLVILQSNDSMDEEGHINAVKDLDEFKTLYPMTHIYYKGMSKFEKYIRFMMIGIK